MKYLDPKFSSRPASKAYRDNYDRVFSARHAKIVSPPEETFEQLTARMQRGVQAAAEYVDALLADSRPPPDPRKPRRRKP